MINFDIVRGFFEESLEAATPLKIAKEGLFDTAELTTAKGLKNPWCLIVVREGDSKRVSIGDEAIVRTDGVVIVSIFFNFGSGTKALREAAGVISSSLVAQRLENLQILTPSLVMIGKTENWMQANLRIPFLYDEITL